ncbi:DUF2567 domain-containing protein [Micromonospora coxensis]|uniref:DUF2567 domain-containing protein n=1 Tax=Micromonospora coxensis TaxID=356852 RepID=A0A1C5HL81_9ACTN|nr:hypothetical protein GA0070614_1471 [Micromonospora coxensis]
MSPDTPDPHRPAEPGRAAPAPADPVDAAHPPVPAASTPFAGTPAPNDPGAAPAAGPDGGAPPAATADGGAPPPFSGTPTGAWPPPGILWPPAYAAPPQPREPLRRTVAVLAATVLGITALGVPLGLLWAAVAPDTPVVKTADGAVYAQPQPEQPIAADGWFSLLGLGFGVLAAIGLWVVLRRRRGPAVLGATALGGLGAALVGWQVGRRIGLGGYQRLLADAPEGTAFGKPADLRAGGIEWVFGVLPVPFGDVLLPAFAAAVTYTLLAGWSRWPSLRPEPVSEPTGLAVPEGSGVPGPPGGASAPGRD